MPLVPPLARHLCQELVRAFTKGRHAQLCLTSFNRIDALCHLGSTGVRRLPSFRQAHRRNPTETHFPWSSAEPEEEHPLLRATLVYDDIQAAAISVAARLSERRDQPCIQSLHLSSHTRL